MAVLVFAVIANASSILGLIVTIGGFWLALHQIRESRRAAMQSKSASEQAREAAQSVRDQLLRFNTVRDISDAIATLEEIQRFQRRRSFEPVPELYGRVRQQLIRIKHRTPGLSEVLESQIQSVVQQVAELQDLMERAISANAEPTSSRINNRISRQISQLTEVSVQLEKALDHTGSPTNASVR